MNVATGGSWSQSQVAVLTDGTLIVGGSGSGAGVNFARYTADGGLISSFSIDLPPGVSYDGVTFTGLSEGGFAVVFVGAGGDAPDEVYSRSFAANGTPTSEFVHDNVATAGAQSEPNVIATTDGGYFVDYTDSSRSQTYYNPLVNSSSQLNSNGAPESYDVRFRFVGADGTAGIEALLSQGTKIAPGPYSGSYDASAGEQRSAVPALLDNGSLVVPYIDRDYYTYTNVGNGYSHDVGSTWSISARIVTSGGVSTPITVSPDPLPPASNASYVEHDARPAAVALAGGGFAIVWTEHEPAPSSNEDTVVRFFDDTGNATSGAVTLLVRPSSGLKGTVELAARPDGGFAMAYETYNGSNHDVMLALVSASGTVESTMAVASGLGEQTLQGLSGTPDGSFNISYYDANARSGSMSGYRVQRFVETSAGDFTRTGSSASQTIASTAPVEHETYIDGEGGNDTITGGAGRNHLYGGAGNDTIDDGGGTSTVMEGGLGNDIFVVHSIGDVVNEYLHQGTDTVLTDLGTYTLDVNLENLTYRGTGDFSGMGNRVRNVLTGGAGNDTFNGGLGADTMIGGNGNDTYVVDNVGDIVTEGSGAGTDLVRSTISDTLGADLENLTLVGTSSIAGNGNGLNNRIIGNSGANTLDGRAGVDTLTGSAGNDTFVFQFGETNGDTVTDFTGAGSAVGDHLKFEGYGAGKIGRIGSSTNYLVTPDAAHGGSAAAETIHLTTVTSLDVQQGAGHNDVVFV